MRARLLALMALLMLALAPLAAPAQDAGGLAELNAQEPDDRGFITRLLERNLSGAGRTVTLEGFRGALSSRATFTRLTIADDAGPWLVLEDGAIQWNRAALFQRRVEIDELTAARITLPRLPQGEGGPARTPEAREFRLPELPVAVEIREIRADRVEIGAPVIGTEAAVRLDGAMSLAGGEGNARLSIDRIDQQQGRFAIDAGFANATRTLRLDVTLDEAPNGIFANLVKIEGRPAVAATIKGEGPLSEFAADITLATDGTPRVAGKVGLNARAAEDGTPGTAFRADISGDIAALLPPSQRDFFGNRVALQVEGWRGEDGRLSLPVLSIDTDALDVTGEVSTAAGGKPSAAKLRLGMGRAAGAGTLPVRLPIPGPERTVDSADLDLTYDAAQGDGWTLKGRLDRFAQPGLTLEALDLDGGGTVVPDADGRGVAQIIGSVGFTASGIAPADPALAAAIGERLEGRTQFDARPGQAVALEGLTVAGTDYSLGGDLTVDGLSSGITLSGVLKGQYADLGRLAALAGVPLKGRADLAVEGLYTLLGQSFDGEATLAGTDVSIGQPQLDRLLEGVSTLAVSARRDATGIEIRSASVDATQLTGTAQGRLSSEASDLTASLRLASLADIDPALGGSLTANAALTGPAGGRKLTLDGAAENLLTGIGALDGALRGRTDVAAVVQESAAEGDAAGWELQTFHLQNPQLALNGAGALTPGKMDATFTVAVPDAGALQVGWAGRLEAEGRVTDAPEGRRFTLTGTGEDLGIGRPELDGLLAGTTRFTAAGTQAGARVTIDEARLTNPQATLDASGVLAGAETSLRARAQVADLAALGRGWGGAADLTGTLTEDAAGTRRFDVTGTATDLRLGQQQADAALTGTTRIAVRGSQGPDGITIDEGRIVNDQAEVTAQGRIGTAQTDFTGTAKIARLDSLGLGLSGALDLKGSLTDDHSGVRRFDLSGTGQDLRLGQQQADAALTGTTQIVVRGTQGPDGIVVEEGRIVNAQAQITAQGRIGSNGTDFTGTAKVAQLESLGLGARGALDLTGSFRDAGDGVRRLEVAGTGQNLALGQAQLDGALTGTTRLDLRATERAGTFAIEAAELVNEQASITATGTIGGGRTDAQGKVAIRRLEALGLGWRGALTAEGTVSDDGSGARRFAVTGTARDLSLGQGQVDAALRGATAFRLRGVQRGGTVTLEEAVVDNPRLAADVTGSVGEATDLRGSLRADSLAFLGRGFGGAVDAEGAVQRRGGVLDVAASGTARGLTVGQPKVDALLRGTTRFDLAARQAGRELTVSRFSAENPQLRATASGALSSGVRVDARLNDLALLVPGFPGPATASGTVRRQGARIGLDLALTGPGGTTATVAGTVAQDGSTADLALRGRSDAAIANPFLRVRSIEGPVDFDLRLNGRPGLEALRGRVTLPSARFSDPKLGVRIDNLRLTADLNGPTVSVNGGGTLADGGTVAVEGRVALAAGAALDLRVTLADAVLRDPNLYETRASGTVTVTGSPAAGPLISGTIRIGRTEVRIPSTGLGGAKDIPKIVHLNERPPSRRTRAKAGLTPYPGAEAREAGLAGPPATPPRVAARLNLTIEAPNQVFIRGRGVDAELGGSLQLTGTVRNVVPVGTFELIRGRVDLLGKRFVLSEGSLQLQGSLIPVIHLVAQTERGGIVTRVTIDGEAQDPDITFSSIPDMPQEEVLSQLLFGRGVENISALQAAQLANAVAVLAGKGGEGIVAQLRRQVGLDDLDVGTDDAGNVTLRAGKYLSDKLYTDVEVGAGGTGRVNLNLDITGSLRARGSVDGSGNSSIGLFYEKDY